MDHPLLLTSIGIIRNFFVNNLLTSTQPQNMPKAKNKPPPSSLKPTRGVIEYRTIQRVLHLKNAVNSLTIKLWHDRINTDAVYIIWACSTRRKIMYMFINNVYNAIWPL
jgi:hypothetical protein